ncbi:MAG: glycosyltransferase [Candidatus Bathyarchaeia archaeon]
MVVSIRNVNILHRDFYYLGGAERVALAFIKYFQTLANNVNVHLITKKVSRDFFNLMRVYGISSMNLNIIFLRNMTPLSKTIYSSLEDIILFGDVKRYLAVEQDKPAITVNTKFNEVPVAADLCFIHYPTYIVLKKNPRDPSLLGPVLGKNYMSSTPLRMYITPLINLCYSLMIRELTKCKAILFNSSFTMHIFMMYTDSAILREIKKSLYVVHPPLINAVRGVHDGSNRNRKYITLRFKPLASLSPETWSRFVAEIAKNFKEATVVVIGFAKTQTEMLYIAHLQKLARNLGLNNVKILVNVSEDIKNLIFRRTKVYVHLIPYEHFGIMPLEALLSGANIVIHKMSGISFDVHLQEPFIIRYSKYPFDLEELLNAISLSYNSENIPSELIQKIRWQYSFDSFKETINRIMENVSNNNQGAYNAQYC